MSEIPLSLCGGGGASDVRLNRWLTARLLFTVVSMERDAELRKGTVEPLTRPTPVASEALTGPTPVPTQSEGYGSRTDEKPR